MNTAIDLNRISANAPVLVPLRRKGKQRNVSNVIQPVRQVVETARITHKNPDGTDALAPAAGYVFTATFLDGTKRELFVEHDEGKMYFDYAHFLKEGRKTNSFDEIQSLEIRDFKDLPSRELKARLKKDHEVHTSAPSLRIG